jgi:glutamate mutase epsilon subunit
MADRRHKNAAWLIQAADKDGKVDSVTVTNAVLMDIRDELQQLNRTMSCHRVASMADAMIRLEKRLAKKFKLRPTK